MKLNEGFKGLGTLPTDKGEVAVTIASGTPIIEKAKGSYLVQVHPKTASNPIKGYTFPNSKIQQIVEKAVENGSDLLLRFEKQRKKDIDKNIPLAELTPDMSTARKNVFNSCVGVYDVNNGKWVLDGCHSDPTLDGEEAEKFIKWATSVEEVNVEGFFEEKVTPVKQVVAPNPSTFDKQQNVITLYYWVKDCEIKHNFSLTEEARRLTTIKLLKLADKIYTVIKGNEDIQVNYSDYAHTRARYAIFKFGEFRALDEESVKNINVWMKDCYNFYKNLSNWASEV